MDGADGATSTIRTRTSGGKSGGQLEESLLEVDQGVRDMGPQSAERGRTMTCGVSRCELSLACPMTLRSLMMRSPLVMVVGSLRSVRTFPLRFVGGVAACVAYHVGFPHTGAIEGWCASAMRSALRGWRSHRRAPPVSSWPACAGRVATPWGRRLSGSGAKRPCAVVERRRSDTRAKRWHRGSGAQHGSSVGGASAARVRVIDMRSRGRSQTCPKGPGAMRAGMASAATTGASADGISEARAEGTPGKWCGFVSSTDRV